MPLHCITIDVSPPHDSEHISQILFELGALSVTVTDRNRNTPEETLVVADPPLHGSLTTASPEKLWPESQIKSLYPLSCDVESLLMLIATHFSLPSTPSFNIHTEIYDEKTPDEWVQHV